MKQKTTYNNDAEFKAMFVQETIKHRKADELIKGTYEQRYGSFKGCAVGCAIETLNTKLNKSYENNDHHALEEEGLYPEWLARLQDTIFERLENKYSQTWPERFAKAIPVGVPFEKLEVVKWKFYSYLMDENIKRVQSFGIESSLKEQVINAIKGVKVVHDNAVKTGKWNKESAARAESAAWSASSAARAESAAWSAARAVAREAREARVAYLKYSKKLLNLLKQVV